MGQYDRHVFVCTSGETCPLQGDTEKYVKTLRAGVQKAGKQAEVRINKAGCFSQCGHGPMVVVYPENVWYAGVQEADLDEILTSHVLGGRPVDRLRYAPGVKGANKTDVPPKRVPAADPTPVAAPEPSAVSAPAASAAAASAPATAPAAPAVAAPAGAAPAPGTWTRVCRSGEVPADGMKQFSVAGTDVLIVDAGGELFAFQALCPHEAVPLDAGVHDGCTLTCLEHLWQFDLRTGAPMGDAQEGLHGYPLKHENGEVYVDLNGT